MICLKGAGSSRNSKGNYSSLGKEFWSSPKVHGWLLRAWEDATVRVKGPGVKWGSELTTTI